MAASRRRAATPAGSVATASRRKVHELRNQVDAILVGAETVLADDPQLTCRVRGGRDPLRVILDGRLRISPQAHVCHLSSKAATVIATTPRAAQLRGAAFRAGRC